MGAKSESSGCLSLISRWASIGLFVLALCLPATKIEGRLLSGFEAFVVGYFCMGIFFWPSHLLYLIGWIWLAGRYQRRAAICGIGALYGPIWWLLINFPVPASLSFPSGWVWLTSVLLLVLATATLPDLPD
jgi:hypothetical protein